jgi:hypothetical protein
VILSDGESIGIEDLFLEARGFGRV